MSCLFPSTHTDSYQGYPQRNSTIVREIYILWPLSFSIHTRLTILVMIVAVSAAFIEQRRRALKRFLLLVVRHPILARDDITKIFLSAGGQVSKKYYQPSSLILYSMIILLSQTFLPEKISPSQLPLHCWNILSSVQLLIENFFFLIFTYESTWRNWQNFSLVISRVYSW